MTRQLLLIRHPEVAEIFKGVCYGSSNLPLSNTGLAQIASIVAQVLLPTPITHIYHSGLQRTALLANAIKAKAADTIPVIADTRIQERCFGEWELQTWDAIYAQTGDAMMGMLQAPESWCPPGGETTFELRDRVLAWYAELPATGYIIAVSHGGPIAALQGTLAKLPVTQWPPLIPAYGQLVWQPPRT